MVLCVSAVRNGLSRLRFSAVMVAFGLILLLVAGPAQAADEEWEFDGGGWGYGVGLSQYGALGQALDGRSSDQILEYYYTGAYVVEMPSDHWTTQSSGLLVGLVSDTTSVDLGAIGGPLTVCQPAATCPPTAPYAPPSFVDVTIDPGEAWKYEVNSNDSTQCRFRKTAPAPVGNLGWKACNATVTKANDTDDRFVVNGQEYAWGQVRFTESRVGFHAVVALSLQQYLYGSDVIPSSWPTHALRAQAVMRRSEALVRAEDRGGPSGSTTLFGCGCHVLGAYAGWSKENPSNGGGSWVQAVNDTEGDILIHPQSYYHAFDIAMPEYSSSNGGASEDVEFVWGTEPGRSPWLRSVEDPWSADSSINPDARWTVVVPASRIKAYLGWDVLTNVEVVTGPPGAVVMFTGRKDDVTVTRKVFGAVLRRFLDENAFRSDGGPVRVSPYVITVRSRGPFADIAGNVFEAAITWMAREGITVGCNPPSNTTYCPEDAVTRGEMAVFLSRMLGLPVPSGDYFSDDEGMFYESAANRLFESGITVGCGLDMYCGERPIAREQMAAFLARTLNLPISAEDHFVDDTGSMFEGAINKIADAGLTLGCNPPTNDRFCPTNHVTRGQMAAFFKRAWGY